MNRATLRRGEATVIDVAAACDRLEILDGQDFCIVPAKDLEAEIGEIGPHNGSSTSRDAAYGNLPRRDSQRDRCLREIVSAGDHGATRDELSAALNLPDSSADGRVWELKRGGFIEDVPTRRRETRNGSAASVLMATPKAIAEIAKAS